LEEAGDYDDDMSLISGESAVYRSIGGDRSVDVGRGIGGIGSDFGPVQSLLESKEMISDFSLTEKHNQNIFGGAADFYPSETETAPKIVGVTAPPSLPEDMHCVMSKFTLFFSSSNDIKKVRAHVLSAVAECDCFEAASNSSMVPPMFEDSEWLVCLTHYSRSKFSIDLNVMFWTINDFERTQKSFPHCPQDANYAIEFQRLGGDCFSWMDLWYDIVNIVEKEDNMNLTHSAKAKRCTLDNDLLFSDSEDDVSDEDDLMRSLEMILDMCNCSDYNGQLEALKTMCRMCCEDIEQCQKICNTVAFRDFVVKSFDELCGQSSMLLPLLRCATSLLSILVDTTGEVDVVNISLMKKLLESEPCQALRYECAKLARSLVSATRSHDSMQEILSSVHRASKNKKNSKKMNEILRQVEQMGLAKHR
jgi:hypothetical protein